MMQPGLGYGNHAIDGHTMMPSAPTLPTASACEDDDAPPSYAEATGAAGGETHLQVGHPGGGTGLEVDADVDTPRLPAAQTGNNDAPPSYQSIYGQVKEARETSSGFCDFIAKVFIMPLGFLIGLVILVAVVALVFVVPVSLLAVGSYYMHDCPLEPGIPVWMVVGGLMVLLHMLQCQIKSDKDSSGCLDFVAALMYLAWYITGTVLVYPNCWPEFYPDNGAPYCGYTVYITAFVVVNILSVIVALLFCMASL